MTEPDGIGEVFEETVRVAASAAATGRTIAVRRREQQLTELRAQHEQHARRVQAQQAAERASALSELAVVEQREWWQSATDADVEHAWQTARRWREREPAASRAAVTLRAEHRRRTGIDLEESIAADPELVEVQRLREASFRQPPSAAVASSPPAPPRARSARRGHSPVLQRERQR